ncbi:MAG: hypothetical protein GKC09_10685 [Methanosarcinales archaeon]|nr:hypothetical protein [Methanosarcinales archaeon]
MAFSQDGMLAMACIDNTARLFDVKTYKETERLEHDGSVYEVAFSSDGSKLVTASSDNTAHLWDVRTGEELQRIELEVLANKFAFSQDGREAAAVSDDGSVLIQTFNISVLMDDACSRVSQNMTRSEWNRSIGNQDCLTCPAEGSFDQSSIWPWGRRECQPCGGHLG